MLPASRSDPEWAGGTYDLPSLTLLGRAVECLKAPPTPFDPILELKSK